MERQTQGYNQSGTFLLGCKFHIVPCIDLCSRKFCVVGFQSPRTLESQSSRPKKIEFLHCLIFAVKDNHTRYIRAP